MLVGRRMELAACGRALDGAVAGRGGLVVLSGEAGIGKTSIARSLVDRAHEAGVVARWGACWESDPVAFGVWVDALRWPDDDAFTSVIGLLERGPGSPIDDDSAARDRRRVFDDVASALRSASAEVPQLVVLEDLHWADESSLQLLRALTTKLPVMGVLVLATCRPDELPVSSLGVGGSIQHVELGGLGLEEVADVLEHSLGRAPTPEEAGRVHSRTGGNPLFVLEVGRLAAAGSLTAVPTGVREILRRRTARLSARCDRLLGVAAVAGTEIDEAALTAVAGMEPEEVRSSLAEAGAARLVELDRAAVGRWRFAHELIRATRYEGLGTGERSQLHARWWAFLESVGASAGVRHHHAVRAGIATGDGRLSRLALEAGQEAAAGFAWEDAVTYFEEALSATSDGATGAATQAEAWLGLGSVRLRLGRDAGEAFLSAAALGRSLGSPEVVGRAALGFGAGFGSFEVQLLDPRQVELLEEAAAALPEGARLRPMVLARLSVALSFMGSTEARLALADEAVALARSSADERALAAGLAARCDALAGPDHVDERLTMSSEIVEIARRAGDARLELLGRRLRVVALLERRDLSGFDAEVAAYAKTADDLGDGLYTWWTRLWLATRAHAAGRLREARRLRAEARSIGVAGGSRNADVLYLVSMLAQAMDEADAAELEAAWSGLVERHPDLFHQEDAVAAMRAFAAARFGDASMCRVAVSAAGSEGLDRLPRDQEWLTTVAQMLVGALVAGDDAVLRRAYDLLLPHAGLGVFEGAAAVDRGVVDRFLAPAAAQLGDAAAARAHADAALLLNADAGELLLAQTRADAAAALLRGSPDDVQRAHQIGKEAVSDLDALGFAWDAAAVRRLLSAQPDPHGSPGRSGADLVRDGDTWSISYAGSTVRIKHAKGVADLALLLGAPGQEVHVRALEGIDDLALPTGGDDVLDSTAVAQYRARLQDLERELDEAHSHADLGRVELLAAERGALVDELTRAFGLRGRARSAGADPDDRLRKAVSARIKASIRRIEDLHPALGHHLRHSVRTGFRCCYDPEEPVRWRVEAARTA